MERDFRDLCLLDVTHGIKCKQSKSGGWEWDCYVVYLFILHVGACHGRQGHVLCWGISGGQPVEEVRRVGLSRWQPTDTSEALPSSKRGWRGWRPKTATVQPIWQRRGQYNESRSHWEWKIRWRYTDGRRQHSCNLGKLEDRHLRLWWTILGNLWDMYGCQILYTYKQFL